MPFVIVRLNQPLTKEDEHELKHRLGQAISLVPGKSEEYLLLSFEDNCRMWLRGRADEPVAYMEAAIFGNLDHRGFDRFAAAATQAFHEVLHIPPHNIYIRFQDIGTWSRAGRLFDLNAGGLP